MECGGKCGDKIRHDTIQRSQSRNPEIQQKHQAIKTPYINRHSTDKHDQAASRHVPLVQNLEASFEGAACRDAVADTRGGL
jgi:hypothetical protein